MTALERIIQCLATGEPRTLTQLLTVTPELRSVPLGVEQLRLLLRLDRRIYQLSDGRWAMVNVNQPEARIVTCAQAYLGRVPGGGASLAGLTQFVAQETHYGEELIQAILLRRFVNNGMAVKNQLKEQP